LIFKQITQALKGEEVIYPSDEEKIEMSIRHLNLLSIIMEKQRQLEK
jgi:tRNA-dihydrouridine synthase B